MAPHFLQEPWPSGLQPIVWATLTPFLLGRPGQKGAGLGAQPCWVSLGALSKKEQQQ